MAKGNQETSSTQAAGPKPINWDDEKDVAHAFAVGMGDGEVIEGRYLGYDIAVTRNGSKARHRFEIVAPGGELKLHTVWGAAQLDAKLAECELGRVTFVRRDGPEMVQDERTGKMKAGRRVLYTVKQAGPIDHDGVIGRNGHAQQGTR